MVVVHFKPSCMLVPSCDIVQRGMAKLGRMNLFGAWCVAYTRKCWACQLVVMTNAYGFMRCTAAGVLCFSAPQWQQHSTQYHSSDC
jgi:hypothetical protein